MHGRKILDMQFVIIHQMVQQGLALLAGEDDRVQRFVGAAEQTVEQEDVSFVEEV